MELYPHQIEALEEVKDKNRMIENWKSIEGYEGMYEVSDKGNVRSTTTSRGRRKENLKPQVKNGYLAVNLYNESGVKHFYIHRLVAKAFIPAETGKNEVNHIDCNKYNNTKENLEWCDRKTNLQHSYANNLKRCGENHGMCKLTLEQVKSIRSSNFTGRELAKIYRVSQSTISAIRTYRNWKEVLPNEVI